MLNTTQISLDATSANVMVGDTLVLSDSSGPDNTLTGRKLSGLLSPGLVWAGVAHTSGSPGSRVVIQQFGIVPSTITGLAPAERRSLVRVNQVTSRLERLSTTPLSFGDLVVGVADQYGNVLLLDHESGVYNVRDFGAAGNGITDDTTAIQSAILAMGERSFQGGVLYFPPGVYQCHDDIHIHKCLEIRGPVGGYAGPARFNFAPGKGIKIWQLGSKYGGNGSGTRIKDIEIWTTKLTQPEWQANCDYTVGQMVHVPGNNQAYLVCVRAGRSASVTQPEVGFDDDPVLPFVPGVAYSFEQLLQLTSDRLPGNEQGSNVIVDRIFQVYAPNLESPPITAGAIQPDVNNLKAYFPGDEINASNSIQTGGVTLVARAAIAPAPQTNQVYQLGDFVYGTHDQKPAHESRANVIPGWYFRVKSVVGDGTTSDSFPVWNAENEGDETVWGNVVFEARGGAPRYQVPDGSIVWSQRVHAGIFSRAQCHIENVYVYNATNAGVTIRASAGLPTQNANASALQNVWSDQCGIGFLVAGGATNVGVGTNLHARNPGYGVRGNGGYGIWDSSLLGWTWIGCQIQPAAEVEPSDPEVPQILGGGPAIRANGGSQRSTFINCHVESWQPGTPAGNLTIPQIQAPAVIIGGLFGNTLGQDCDTATVLMSACGREGARNLVGKVNLAEGKQLSGGIGIPATSKAINWSHTDDGNTYYGITHSSQMDAQTYPANWWVFGYGTRDDAQCLAMAGYNANWPSGVPLNTPANTNANTNANANANTNTNANDLPPGFELWVPRQRFFVGQPTGNGDDPPSIEFADAPPTTGHYARGSLIWKRNPSPGDPLGWRCLVATQYRDCSRGIVSEEAVWEQVG